MDDLIAFLDNKAGAWQGAGISHDRQDFTASLTIEQRPNDRASSLRFRATGLDGTLFHEEALLIGEDSDGRYSCVSTSSNMPGSLHFAAEPEPPDVIFLVHGDPADLTIFREVVTLRFREDGAMTYSFAWGLPGQEIAPRSEAVLRRGDLAPTG